MSGRRFMLFGGPFDGLVRVYHEGNGAVFPVSERLVPGEPPRVGRAIYKFTEERTASGCWIARYASTDWDPSSAGPVP